MTTLKSQVEDPPLEGLRSQDLLSEDFRSISLVCTKKVAAPNLQPSQLAQRAGCFPGP